MGRGGREKLESDRMDVQRSEGREAEMVAKATSNSVSGRWK